MDVYKIICGNKVEFVASRSMNQALMNARMIFGEGQTVSAELASAEETNALLRSHSIPSVRE
jgi:hypothetical protein